MPETNPIKTVDGVAVKAPSVFVWKLQDLSKPEAGMTEDMVTHKMRIGQKLRLEVSWDYTTIAEAATILTQFNPEYVWIDYLDAKAGAWLTKEFYVGDREAPLFDTVTGRWEAVGFGLILRKGDA